MEIGTVKTELKSSKKKRKLSTFGGSGSSGGGSDDNGGGNNGGGFSNYQPEAYEKSFGKSKIFAMFLLIVVLMTFGGVISAYVVIATNGVLEWRPFNLPFQVYISTLLILASSLTYIIGQNAVFRNEQPKAKNWLLGTTVLGGIFISSQILVWIALVNRGYYMASNPYASFFYILTALHAVHVLGGIIALGYIVLQNWYPTENENNIERRREISSAVGWYWHFMGGLWMVLILLLGFWK